MADAVYQLSDVVKRYRKGRGEVLALRGVNLVICDGEWLAIQGPTGHGKSTLLQILGGLDHPTSGTVEFDGVNLARLPETRVTRERARSIGFVFQTFNLIPTLSAAENVEVALVPLGFPASERRMRAEEGLSAVGLGDRLRHLPSELSGGQQQRVAIARALASRPTVMFADEPTGNLDSATSGEILNLLRSMVTTYGQTTVMVTHDANAAAMADRVLFLADGQIVRDQGRSEASDVLAAMAEVSAL